MNRECVILIISHKEILSEAECKSIYQCFRILTKYEIVIITKKSNSLEFYKKEFPKCILYLADDEFLDSYNAFNNFKLSSKLYYDFIQFRYILFYEPDAWVFNDQIQYWINKKYDYVGAPWFSSMTVCDPTAPIVGVGNGGFSLRNTRKHYSVLRRVEQLRLLHKWWQKLRLHKIVVFNQFVLRFNFYFNIAKFWELPYLLDDSSPVQEDVFLCYRVADGFRDFKLAPAGEAVRFSFEVNPSVLYEMNSRQLPFGCHGWQKYEPDFWKEFISH